MPRKPKPHKSPVQEKINRGEFIRMWNEDGMTLKYLAKHFKTSPFTVRAYAKSCKLGPRCKVKEEVIVGGLPGAEWKL